MIALRRIDHVGWAWRTCDEASRRWARSSASPSAAADGSRATTSRSASSSPRGDPAHVAYELRRSCSLDDARAHLDAPGVPYAEREGGLLVADPDGNGVQLLPYREPASRWTPHARPAGRPAGRRTRASSATSTSSPARSTTRSSFYTRVLGMEVTDWLGDGGVWLHINADHHVMALIDKGYAHFHHLAFDVVDIGQMRAALDHLGRHGRWLGWGPTRHGVGGNIASYVRIVEEACFVELYCDMEQLEPEHEPRRWPDDRFSSNTWGPLPPRSYFRFDDAAIASERESLEMLGQPLARRLRGDAPGLHASRARRPAGRASSRRRRGTTSATSSSSTTGPIPTPCAALLPAGPRAAPGPRAAAPPSSPTGSRARRAATSCSTRPLALPRVLHRGQRAARRRGGHDLPVHLGRPGLRARARLDPGLPEEARLDLDDADVRARPRRRPGAEARRAATAGRARARGRAIADMTVTLERRATDGPRHNAPPIVNVRHFPRLAAGRHDDPQVHELVRARQPRPRRLRRLGGRGRRSTLHAAPHEEHDALAPVRIGRGYRFTFGYTVDDLVTVKEIG